MSTDLPTSLKPEHYDVLVIGSGAAGTALAAAFGAAGRRTVMVERGLVGGTCINVGCTPTKAMIASGRTAHVAAVAGEFGVLCGGGSDGDGRGGGGRGGGGGGSGAIQVDMEHVRQRKRDMVRLWRQGSEARLRQSGVDIIRGEASFTKRSWRQSEDVAEFATGAANEVTIRLNDEDDDGGGNGVRNVVANIVIINTGERPAKPALPGLGGDDDAVDPARVLDSTSIMELGEVPGHLLVVGGGYVGLEFGQLFRRLGAQVTIVQRAAQLAPREDEDVAQVLLDILEEDGVAVHLSTEVVGISQVAQRQKQGQDAQQQHQRPVRLQIRSNTAGTVLEGSHVLLATGRRPNTEALKLHRVGVNTTERGSIVVDEKLETSSVGIFAVGDVHGGPTFTHISYDDFRIIGARFLSSSLPARRPLMRTSGTSISRNLVPYVVYTDPQLAHVGIHARDRAKVARETLVAKMPVARVARAAETGETRGLLKATVDGETGEILGFTCLAPEGGELMAVVQMAMMGGLKWWDLEATVWAHPSMAESLNRLWEHLE